MPAPDYPPDRFKTPKDLFLFSMVTCQSTITRSLTKQVFSNRFFLRYLLDDAEARRSEREKKIDNFLGFIIFPLLRSFFTTVCVDFVIHHRSNN